MGNHWLPKTKRYLVEGWDDFSHTWLMYGQFDDLADAIRDCAQGFSIKGTEHRVVDVHTDTAYGQLIYLIQFDGSIIDFR